MICPLCDRNVETTSKHHVVPKSKGGKITVDICIPCHNSLHKIYTNNELRDNYNTIELLRSNDRFEKYLRWIKKKPPEFVPCFKEKK